MQRDQNVQEDRRSVCHQTWRRDPQSLHLRLSLRLEVSNLSLVGIFAQLLKSFLSSEQQEIFAETAYPVCENVIQGYNGTIFAYGQTGTGKTFTITGVPEDNENKGIMPRSFENIFQQIQSDTKKQYLVRVSYLEIYNEEIRDLLNKKSPRLELRDKDTGVYVKDLSTFVVKKPEDMMKVFLEGNVNRHVGQTNMNEHSSRSHSVFTITVESSEMDE